MGGMLENMHMLTHTYTYVGGTWCVSCGETDLNTNGMIGLYVIYNISQEEQHFEIYTYR